MKLLSVMAPVAVIAFFPACASIVSGTQKNVRIISSPPGALVKLDGATRALTPAVLHPPLEPITTLPWNFPVMSLITCI